jgi:hypothetical protein
MTEPLRLPTTSERVIARALREELHRADGELTNHPDAETALHSVAERCGASLDQVRAVADVDWPEHVLD